MTREEDTCTLAAGGDVPEETSALKLKRACREVPEDRRGSVSQLVSVVSREVCMNESRRRAHAVGTV